MVRLMVATGGTPVEGRKTSSDWILRLAILTCWLGGALIGLTACSLLITFIYEWIVPPTDMHPLGLLSAVLLFYLAPVGAALVAVGGILWIGATFATRKDHSPKRGQP